eukprot:710691-Amorphochlora_amoeboformis.AAC.2
MTAWREVCMSIRRAFSTVPVFILPVFDFSWAIGDISFVLNLDLATRNTVTGLSRVTMGTLWLSHFSNNRGNSRESSKDRSRRFQGITHGARPAKYGSWGPFITHAQPLVSPPNGCQNVPNNSERIPRVEGSVTCNNIHISFLKYARPSFVRFINIESGMFVPGYCPVIRRIPKICRHTRRKTKQDPVFARV